jgi:hypothetical protein
MSLPGPGFFFYVGYCAAFHDALYQLIQFAVYLAERRFIMISGNRGALLLLVFILSLPSILSAQEVAYSGKIANKYGIGMQLTFTGNRVQGYYGYENQPRALHLRGTIAAGKILLEESEYDLEWKTTGTFEGIIQRDSSVTGQWRNAQGTKTLPFLLTKEKFTLKPGTVTLSSESSSIEGCSCLEITKFKIDDPRLTTYLRNKLRYVLNSAHTDAIEECPCTDNPVTQGMTECTRDVHYNANNLLTIKESISGIGAYPSSSFSYFTVSLVTGEPVSTASLFKKEKHAEIRTFVQKELRKLLDDVLVDLKKEKDESLEFVKESGETALAQEQMPEFFLDGTLFFFQFHWGFPHVITALEPSGEVEITKEVLSSWINPEGPLNFFLKQP